MKPATIALTLGVALLGAATVSTQSTPMTSAEALKQSRVYAFQFREGQYDVAPKALALLESATSADPGNAALWNALSTAYFMSAGLAGQPGRNPMDAFEIFPRAMGASERALQIDPDNPEALATHGAALTLASLFQQKPELGPKGVAEMNRAVALGPTMVQPRLQRAFFGLNLPVALRDQAAIVADLTFLAAAAEGSRAGDMVHVLLGDFYAEIGRLDEARREYEAAARRPASVARDRSAVRLEALKRDGAVPAADVAAMRAGLASDCAMCHAK